MGEIMNIVDLKTTEAVKLDSARLANLFIEMGEAGAQNVVCRAMEELAIRLAVVDHAYQSGETAVLAKSAKALIGIAEQIGMVGLADAARNLCFCAQGVDENATAATLARLLRIGDCSLTEVWDIQDLSV